MKNRYAIYFLLILSTLTTITGCATSERAVEPENDVIELEPISEGRSLEELRSILTATRNSLSDVYYTQTHDMPKVFLKKDTVSHIQRDPFAGFRIQILSTRDMALADSVTGQFRLWADTTLTGYIPKAYISFKQPFYKVHVGDFKDQSRANDLSKLVKKKYPGAWVVHDRIDPEEVPADTVLIGLIKKKSELETQDQ